MADDDHLKRLVNASGYAFQLAVENLVSNGSGGEFRVVAREHPWLHPGNRKSGFIDFIVEKSIVRFVVECKRTTDADWLFLISEPNSTAATVFDCYWSCILEKGREVADWSSVILKPDHPTSQFCCVRGSGEGSTPFLDGIAANMVYAIESLAVEEAIIRDPQIEQTTVYLPVVVTNAKLYAAQVDLTKVNLDSGRLDDCTCMEAGAVRYRKALDPGPHRLDGVRSINEANARSQRTVMVVNVAHLTQLLAELQFARLPWRDLPWIEALKRHAMRR